MEIRHQRMEIMQCMDEQGYIDLRRLIEFREEDESFLNKFAFKIAIETIYNEIDAILGESVQ